MGLDYLTASQLDVFRNSVILEKFRKKNNIKVYMETISKQMSLWCSRHVTNFYGP